MSKIPKVGLHIVALMLLTVVASFGARLANYWRFSRQEMIVLPMHIDVDGLRWQGSEVPPPQGDAERDHPASQNVVFQLGTHAPIFVSIARANTINTLRSPASYLMDKDGILAENEKILIRPSGEKHSHFLMQIGRGHDNSILLVHWVQAPGQSAYADPAEVPTSIAKSLLLHSTFYVCDVWVPLRADSDGAFTRRTLIQFATNIEEQIKSGHLAALATPVIPSAADLNRLPAADLPTLPSSTLPPLSGGLTPGSSTPTSGIGPAGGGNVLTPPTDPGLPVPGGGL